MEYTMHTTDRLLIAEIETKSNNKANTKDNIRWYQFQENEQD